MGLSRRCWEKQSWSVWVQQDPLGRECAGWCTGGIGGGPRDPETDVTDGAPRPPYSPWSSDSLLTPMSFSIGAQVGIVGTEPFRNS